MGLLDLLPLKSSEEKRADSVRKGRVVPEKSERQKCWNTRDEYYACLDRSGIVDALADAEKAAMLCKAEEEKFDRDCPAAWVSYFKKWRVADIKKKENIAKLEAMGAIPASVDGGFGSVQKRSS